MLGQDLPVHHVGCICETRQNFVYEAMSPSGLEGGLTSVKGASSRLPTFRSGTDLFQSESMTDSRTTLFCLLYREWDAAQQRADNEWADVCARVRCHQAGLGDGPQESDVARAVRLEREASEWLTAIRRHLELERRQVQIL